MPAALSNLGVNPGNGMNYNFPLENYFNARQALGNGYTYMGDPTQANNEYWNTNFGPDMSVQGYSYKAPQNLSQYYGQNGYDVSKMPQTRFGDVGRVSAVGRNMLLNPNLKYTDPNYGIITPTNNIKEPNNPYETIAAGLGTGFLGGLTLGPLISAASKGMGGGMMGNMVGSAIRGAPRMAFNLGSAFDKPGVMPRPLPLQMQYNSRPNNTNTGIRGLNPILAKLYKV